MTHPHAKRFLHIQSVASLPKLERWPGCGLAVFFRVTLGVIGLVLGAAALAYQHQMLHFDMNSSTIYTAGICGGVLLFSSIVLPSRWCRKMSESILG